MRSEVIKMKKIFFLSHGATFNHYLKISELKRLQSSYSLRDMGWLINAFLYDPFSGNNETILTINLGSDKNDHRYSIKKVGPISFNDSINFWEPQLGGRTRFYFPILCNQYLLFGEETYEAHSNLYSLMFSSGMDESELLHFLRKKIKKFIKNMRRHILSKLNLKNFIYCFSTNFDAFCEYLDLKFSPIEINGFVLNSKSINQCFIDEVCNQNFNHDFNIKTNRRSE